MSPQERSDVGGASMVGGKSALLRLCRSTAAAAVAAVTSQAMLGTAAADEVKLKTYGQHLAHECTSCHRIDGIDNGIPSIVGWPAETFISTIKFYRDGSRTNPVM